MAHTIYENFVLANEVEDQFKSHLNLAKFCKKDNSLVGTPGMKKKINVYMATDGTEKLAMGEGNSKNIDVSFVQKEYEIALAQNRFPYYDEQEMADPMVVEVGMRHAGTDLYNTTNDDVYAEYKKATLSVVAENFDFDAFVDASAKLDVENLEDLEIFAFVCNDDVAEIRKKLKDSLQYVESFARKGYVGTVAGINVYTKKDADKGTIVVATNEAVTLFNKKGVEVEQERDGDHRKNTIYSRKYYIAALTDYTKAVKIVKSIHATSVSIPDTKTVAVGASVQLPATVVPENTTDVAVWTSSDETKATVDQAGKVTGVATGSANITVTINGKNDTCAVTVS